LAKKLELLLLANRYGSNDDDYETEKDMPPDNMMVIRHSGCLFAALRVGL
jgi:hypothetical protein